MKARTSFRLHILGKLDDYSQPLITFAEFNNSRAIERIELDKERVAKLAQRIRALHKSIANCSPPFEGPELIDLGDQLCQLIFQRKVRNLFDFASGQSQLLPLEIFVEDAAITGWPWEFLFDSTHQKFLSQEFHPISRGIFTVFPQSSLRPLKGKVRLLYVIGVLPGDKTAPEDEIKWIKEVSGTQLANDSVNLEIMQAVRPEDLDKKIQSNKYDILHYFGHARFDDGKEEGYLKLERPEAEPFRLYANDFAMMFANKKIRLVFLNGCETGRNSKNEDPARSSIAAALLARGVPAIIATQFSIPDVTAHYLSNTTYNSLLTGQPLVEAMRNGRRAMRFSEQSRITDWGIPVLYTTDPELIIFPKPKYKRIGWAAAYDEALKSDDMLSSLETAGKPNAPSVTVERTAILEKKRMARMSVALVDFDAKVGFLPDLVEQANDVQTFYNFEVNYLPMPTVAIRQGLKDAYGKKVGPQLYLPHVEDYLVKAPANLQVDKLCCLTRYWVAGRDKKGKQFEDYRASALNTSEDVLAISVVKLRDYAQQAAISYPKAVLYVCLSLIVASDQRLPAMFHKKTSGCLFDYCENQDDIVVGLKKMQFDHAKCRQLIKDKKQLKAIDALLALDLHGSDSV